MATAAELDPSLKQALNYLHSTNPQSAEEIRNCLDEIIKQRFGTSKMLSNTISRKHLDEEPKAPGTIAIIEDLILTQSPKTISDSPNTIAESDDMGGALTISEEVENLKEFGDLKCVVCGEMIVTATNRLIECSKCGSLYHQMCHKPNITDEEADEQELSWTCTNCQTKTTAAAVVAKIAIDESALIVKAKSSSASSSRSSSSSTSSSPYYRQEHSSSSSSKHNHKSKSSSSKEPSVSKSSSSSAVITPCINVISADKTSYSSKKSSSHSSGSSSSKSKSKHESSSSKRKSSK